LHDTDDGVVDDDDDDDNNNNNNSCPIVENDFGKTVNKKCMVSGNRTLL
jgi:hypothetical protein